MRFVANQHAVVSPQNGWKKACSNCHFWVALYVPESLNSQKEQLFGSRMVGWFEEWWIFVIKRLKSIHHFHQSVNVTFVNNWVLGQFKSLKPFLGLVIALFDVL